MEIEKNSIPGCCVVYPRVAYDERGSFVKVFQDDAFRRAGLRTDFKETFYTVSNAGVLRGLHFQRPPFDHAKLVYCVEGEVWDVVVDLRKGSPTYGKYEAFLLNSNRVRVVYAPSGLAHGFYVLSEKAIMVYHVTSAYSPEHDTGILWNSVSIPWPDMHPHISQRDSGFVGFDQFQTPFAYHGHHG